MRLLIDTHILAWAAFEPGKLSRAERARLADDRTRCAVSPISIWELRLKWNSRDAQGRRKGPGDPAQALLFAAEAAWELLALTHAHAMASLAVPMVHKDPFDEMLLIQAQEEGIRLLTRDGQLVGHPVALNSSAPA